MGSQDNIFETHLLLTLSRKSVRPIDSILKVYGRKSFVGSVKNCVLIRTQSLNVMNRHAVRAPVIDLEEPEGATKVRIRFRLQGRFTAPTRQSPQVDRESDQSTRKGRHQHSSPTQILGQGPDRAHLVQGFHRLVSSSLCVSG